MRGHIAAEREAQTPSVGAMVVAAVVATVALQAVPVRACVGDCKDRGTVDVADLITGVNIALGTEPVSACDAFANPAGAVTVAQLIQGVNNALTGCADRRFVDNGDGTISDKQTGLMWEKKVGRGGGMDPENLHAADNLYLWAGTCPLSGEFCQPDDFAAAACAQGAPGVQADCATCQPEPLGLDNSCGGSATTIWAWLDQLNDANFAGHRDWRIPTATELESINDYALDDPSTDSAFNGTMCGAACTDLSSAFCSCTQYCTGLDGSAEGYWSASHFLEAPYEGWFWVDYCGGAVNYWVTNQFVRAVRGGTSSPIPRFVDNGDGTISDKQTGLMWEQKDGFGAGVVPGDLHSAHNEYDWVGECSGAPDTLCQPNDAAAAACTSGARGGQTGCTTCPAGLGSCVPDPDYGGLTTIWDWIAQLNAANFAGHTDWRIPTIEELESIADYTVANPALDPTLGDPPCGMPGVGCETDYAATTGISFPDSAWFVGFADGEVFASEKIDSQTVRAVRGGS